MQNPNWQDSFPGMSQSGLPGGQGDSGQIVNGIPATQAATWQGGSPGVTQTVWSGGQESTVLPKMDVLETDAEFIYIFEVPGQDPDQINVEVSAREIALIGPKPTAGTYRAIRYHSLERPQGRYMRLLRTPPNVNTNDATARYRHGELELRLPKKT